MAKGTEAKRRIADKLAEVFGPDYIGEFDKKYYIWSSENGERVQVAISMTCPKTPVEFAAAVEADGDWDFSDDKPKSEAVAVSNAAPAEITEHEQQNIADLMARLGL